MGRSKSRRKRSNNTGGLYQRTDGTWVGQWSERDGVDPATGKPRSKRKTKTFSRDRLWSENEMRRILTRVADGLPGLEKDETRNAITGNTMGDLVEVWLDQRTNKTAYDDRRWWERYWKPEISHLLPAQVTVAVVKKCFIAFQATGLSNSSLKHLAVLLSGIFGDLIEEDRAEVNPIRSLSKKTRRTFLKSKHDPKKVPFVREAKDIQRIYSWLYERAPSVAVGYAIGAMAGLRTGEVRALSWAKVDLEARTLTIDVQVQRRVGKKTEQLTADGLDTVKDHEMRVVPIFDSLYPILVEWKVVSGGAGLVCPSIRKHSDREIQTHPSRRVCFRRFLGERLMTKMVHRALVALKIEPELQHYDMCWYASTRHTFASQWVRHRGELRLLQHMMGHESIATTERYAHLSPDTFTDADRSRVKVDFTPAPEPKKETPAAGLPVN
jgi:integrase